MVRTRPMARLTGDAELGHARVDDLGVDGLRSERRVELRPAVGRVARDTRAVPVAGLREERFPRRMQDGGAPRNPALLGDQVGARQLAEQPIPAGRIPIDLLVMRAGDHHDLPRDARTLQGVGPTFRSGVWAAGVDARAKARAYTAPGRNRHARTHRIWII